MKYQNIELDEHILTRALWVESATSVGVRTPLDAFVDTYGPVEAKPYGLRLKHNLRAIKAVRDATGMDLRTCKDYVESIPLEWRESSTLNELRTLVRALHTDIAAPDDAQVLIDSNTVQWAKDVARLVEEMHRNITKRATT